MRVVIIGASSSIGQAIAERFASDGARVVGISLEESGNPVLTADLTADCGVADTATDAVERAIAVLGGVDVLVPAAGAMPTGPAHQTTDEQWRRAMSSCLDTFFHTARAALPHLGSGAAIVAVSSVNAFLAAPWVPAYAAAKGGVDALVRQLALDYARRGVRVNAVAPGVVGGVDPAKAAGGYPLGRTITPEEVAASVVFLGGPTASGITGVVLPVDGGLSITSPAAFVRADLLARLEANG
ncbi:SDR family NAD(P)-dependent oxidoreductase [Phytoactinopolyspora endophytica]|uniref:SDR family NAD(P)-dependent oxidoreductase n=1 Tax=Phytoactinopolyspora endophytica TaxID=1642495 RepID=UPI00101E0C89|nr:SDR family oxidoreductase [Phytoactinopolyspora endophytica]